MNLVKRLVLVLGLFVASAGATGCGLFSDVVKPGNVAIKVYNVGQSQGVQDYPIQTGRVWYNPWTTDLYTWPTYKQRIEWRDGQMVSVNADKGTNLKLPVAIQYRLDPNKIATIFVTYRKNIEEINNGVLPDLVRDAFSQFTQKMDIEEIINDGGLQTLTQNVHEKLKTDLGPQGFIIDSVSIIGQISLPSQIQANINAVQEAKQRAIKVEAELRETEAEAAKRVAQAKGQADAILMEAKAQAEANRILAESLNQYGDKVLESKALDKWDGVLPQVVGSGGTPFINVNRK